MRQIKQENSYTDVTLKLIPSEMIGIYLAIVNMIPERDVKIGMPVVALILFILTPVFLWKIKGVRDKKQIAISTFEFILWVYCIGPLGPFSAIEVYIPWVAGMLLVLWKAFTPAFMKDIFIDDVPDVVPVDTPDNKQSDEQSGVPYVPGN